MGHFGRLPAEIRFKIWEIIFGDIRANPKLKPDPLSIMHCSSTLHGEISHLLYRNHSVHVLIHGRCSEWGILRAQSKALGIGYFCIIQNKYVARRLLRALPFRKFRVPEITVAIQASFLRGDDHICLAQKVNRLVDILFKLPCTPRVRVVLVGMWICEELSSLSGPPLGYNWILGGRFELNGRIFYHCDTAMLPFTRLADWDFTIPSDLHEPIATDRRLKVSFLYRFTRRSQANSNLKIRLTEAEAQDISRWRLIYRRVLDHELDTSISQNAYLLQRERFETWYRSGDSWSSGYEKQLWTDLITDFDAMMMVVPWLSATKDRFRFLIQDHDIAFKHLAWLPAWSEKCPISHLWNPVAIRKKWPVADQLARYPCTKSTYIKDHLSKDQLICARFNRYITEVPHFREFWSDLQWWGSFAENFMSDSLVGPKVCPQCLELNASCHWC
ncbi:hypothetical protein N7540_002072 [Penicillium herquei]|nr:hypothetical protein N7540_002072 [Penicillium herquei]